MISPPIDSQKPYSNVCHHFVTDFNVLVNFNYKLAIFRDKKFNPSYEMIDEYFCFVVVLSFCSLLKRKLYRFFIYYYLSFHDAYCWCVCSSLVHIQYCLLFFCVIFLYCCFIFLYLFLLECLSSFFSTTVCRCCWCRCYIYFVVHMKKKKKKNSSLFFFCLVLLFK